MRWSIATKIFLGFAAIILAFGSVGLVGLWQMQQMRRNVQIVRKGVLPLTAELASRLRELKVYEEELGGTRDRDLVRLQRYFPNFKPFEGVLRIEEMVQSIRDSFRLDDVEEEFLLGMKDRLDALRLGTDLRPRLEMSADVVVGTVLAEVPQALSNAAVYEALARAFIHRLHGQRLSEARALEEVLVSIVRLVRNEVVGARRDARRFMAQVDRNAQVAESRTMLMISVAMGVALLAALLVMVWAGLTLRPLVRLREGARRVARGDFTAVNVHTTDEIGQLADEFNRMATSLAERDRLLATQSEELRRTERLATIGKMASQITHEIRNPLSSMGLNSELLEDELADLAASGGDESVAEASALVGAIRGEIDRLTAVTEQYLRFARLPKPTLADADLNALLSDLLSFMRGEMLSRGVRSECELSANLPPVALDRNQVRQAVLNLLRNSIEALNDGGVVRIETRRLSPERIELLVGDTGPGIEEETLARVFEPFFTTKATGTGLGLALVQQIVAEHGGTVECHSKLGEGTTFRIELPVG